MKPLILIIGICIQLMNSVQGQNNINLHIRHLLEGAPFKLEQPAKNNLGHSFMLTRMEYYLGGISIEHDGGKMTTIDSFWHLVNAENESVIQLGEFPIEKVEKIYFHVGVDSLFNHRDPTLYPDNHPLALKEPSMHWGWTSGYRFLALEGWAGDQYNQLLQIHSLGDINYFKTSVKVTETGRDGIINLRLDADYVHVLKDLSIKLGMIFHGENNAARRALQNMRDNVFKPSAAVSAVINETSKGNYFIYPNPASEGEVFIHSGNTLPDQIMTVSDESGLINHRVRFTNTSATIDISHLGPGVYIIRGLDHEGSAVSLKLIKSDR
jgi:hypothetical protein